MQGDEKVADPQPADPAELSGSGSDASEKTPASKPLTLRQHARQPVGLIILAVIILVGAYFGLHAWLAAASYPGEETVVELIGDLDRLNGTEFEEVKTDAGALDDWMFLTSGLDEFKVPESFAGVSAIGFRVRDVEGHPVVQIVLDGRGAILQIFRSSDFQVKSRKPGEWVLHQTGDWTGAFSQSNGLGYIVAFQGSEEEMRTFLDAPAKIPIEG